MNDHGVDKDRYQEGVNEVNGYLAPFSDTAGHNCGGRGSESVLEKERVVSAIARWLCRERKVVRADETVAVVGAIRKTCVRLCV